MEARNEADLVAARRSGAGRARVRGLSAEGLLARVGVLSRNSHGAAASARRHHRQAALSPLGGGFLLPQRDEIRKRTASTVALAARRLVALALECRLRMHRGLRFRDGRAQLAGLLRRGLLLSCGL